MRQPSQHEILGYMIMFGVPALLVLYLVSITPIWVWIAGGSVGFAGWLFFREQKGGSK